MTRRPPVLLLAAAVVVIGGALAAFLLTGSDPASTGAADRTVVAFDPSEGGAAAADLEGVTAREGGSSRAAAVAPDDLERPVRSAKPRLVAPSGPYRGRILDNLGRPLGGVELTLQPWEEANEISLRNMQFGQPPPTQLKTTTDDEGRFVIEKTKPLGMSIGVTALARGFLRTPMKHVFDEPGDSDLGDVFLEPGVIVEGWVRDEDERPIAGARVRRIERGGDAMVEMLDQIGFSAVLDLVTTDADGRFEMPHEKSGPIVLLAEHDDIMPARFEGPAMRPGEVLPDIVITARRAGRIEGRVEGYPDGRVRGVVAAAALDPSEDTMAKRGMSAVMSASLSPAGEHVGKIAKDGTFVVGGLTPGIRYELRGVERRRFVETVSLTNAVEADADGEFVTLEFDPGAQVELRVIDRVTRKPITRLEVAARWDSGPAKTMLTPDGAEIPKRFPGGEVKLHELRPMDDPGKLTVTIDAPGYLRKKSKPIAVAKGGRADGGIVELDKAQVFRFRVVDAATRQPIKRARVMLTIPGLGGTEEEQAQRMITGEIPPRQWAKTDRDGRCELPGIAVETALLEVRARGYAKYVETPFDAVTPRDEIEIAIARGGAVEVAAVDSTGALVEGIRAECRRQDGDASWLSGKLTNERGAAVFDALPAGTYEIRAIRSTQPAFGRPRGDDEDDDWMDVAVEQGETTRVEYTLPAAGGVRGVVMMGGDPAVGARVSVVKEAQADQVERFIDIQDQFSGFGNQREGDTTGADGAFELTDVEVGRYALMVRHPDVAMVTRQPVDVGTDWTEVEVEIVMTTLEGTVVDDAGAPVSDAEISVRRSTGEGDDDVRLTRSFLGMSTSMTRTDGDGRFRVVGVKAATPLEVVVRADGFTDAVSKAVTVTERETRAMEPIEIERAGSVLATIVGEELETQVLFVTAEPANDQTLGSRKIELVRAGRAKVGGLRAGSWTLRTRGSRRRPGEQATLGTPVTVEVKPGETVEIELER